MYHFSLSDSLIDDDAKVEFHANDLVLVVTDDARVVARAVRPFNLREVYDRYVAEDHPNTIDAFYQHLFDAAFLAPYEGRTKEMHLETAACSGRTITVYDSIG